MNILSKAAWSSLGQVSLVFMLFAIAGYFLELNNMQNSFHLWAVSVGASFTALKLYELKKQQRK